VRGLARLLLEAHAQELGLAPGLHLDLGHELALGLLGGEPRDGLELAALLLEGRAQPRLLLPEASLPVGQGPVASLELGVAPVELIQPPAELLLLLGDAALQVLQLPLAGAGFLVQLGPRIRVSTSRALASASRIFPSASPRACSVSRLASSTIRLARACASPSVRAATARAPKYPTKAARRATTGTSTTSQVMAFIDHSIPGRDPVRIMCTRGNGRQVAAKSDEL
jgi:hypothetical protein